jgi:intein/homing endonuclease
MIRTKNGDVAAKNLRTGDIILVPRLAEMDADNPGDDESAVLSWEDSTLTFLELVETTVEVITLKRNPTLFFNGHDDIKFSLTQPIYVRREDSYGIISTGSVEEGDFLIKVSESGEYEEELVESITTDETLSTTYNISCEPYDWFIAGGYLVHNK